MRAVVLVTALVLFTDATSPFPRPTARESADDRTAEVWRAILAIEDARTLTALELKTLSDLIRSRADGLEAAALAVRALGRIERPDAVPVLLEVLHVEGLRDEAATALMLILRASAAQAQASADMSAIIDQVIPVAAAPVLARLPYTRPDQVVRVEKQLLSLIDARLSYRPLGTVSRAFETLTRLNRKLWQPSEETLEAIRRIARAGMPGMTRADWMPRMNAVAALIAARAVTWEVIADTINDAEPQVRRLAVFALSVGISKIDEGPRREIILKALADPSPLVRYEGVRAWARHEAATHGCAPLIDGRSDPDLHVGLAAIDALGDQCRGDGTIDRWLAGDLKTVVTAREWHRPVHALVALAKRAPERAAQHLQPFVRHRTWQVRMYAARAAGHMRDLRSLERLANDEDDNVRDAGCRICTASRRTPITPPCSGRWVGPTISSCSPRSTS